MSASDERPISVAELLARNGTIGSPPVGGHRRRRRRNSDGVSVAELTGEIPVIRTGEIPAVAAEEEVETPAEAVAEAAGGAVTEQTVDESDETVVVYPSADATYSEPEVVYLTEDVGEAPHDGVAEDVAAEDVAAEDAVEDVTEDVTEASDGTSDEASDEGVTDDPTGEVAVEAPPPLSNDPSPHRHGGPELGHDPRPLRRSSGAEQMAYDPVDGSVNLDDLLDENVEDAEQLRSYLRASQDTLFSGGTVADDLARRGVAPESAEQAIGDIDRVATVSASSAPRQLGTTLWDSVLAVLQSLIAVVVGAVLFIGFDQLWRWNNLVALILSVLVVLTLAAGVRFVRKTEDIVSTLTAVAVGLLVTLGPLALQST